MTPIRLRSLRKLFGDIPAVCDVDLDIAPGEIFFLLGPSGCGKTTLLRMLAGLESPTSGCIEFGGRDVTALAAEDRRCAMVFQHYALWPHMTVAGNVAFGLDMKKLTKSQKRDRVEAALAAVRLSEQKNRRPAELSGGQQQRVALARALVVQPAVLLLDEPLSNLDARLRQQMRDEIRTLCVQTRVTTVYVTHDQKEALSMADRIAVMHEGRIAQVATPHELYRRPVNRFVAEFLGQTNFLPGRVLAIQDGGARVETPAGVLNALTFPPDLKPDDEVTCSIRPEAISRAESQSPHMAETASPKNIINAKLTRSVYLGELSEEHWQVNDALELIAFHFNPRFANGEERTHESPQVLTFASEDVVVLRD